jgi:hypothetical protein
MSSIYRITCCFKRFYWELVQLLGAYPSAGLY